MKRLTKSLFMTGRNCPRRMHYQAFRPDIPIKLTDDEKARMEMGKEVERLAMELFPDAQRPPMSPADAPNEGLMSLIEEGAEVIAQGVAASADCEIRFDVLRRVGEAWELIEIKSSSRLDDSKHGAELEFQRRVLEDAGVPVGGLTLCRVNSGAGSRSPLELFAFDDAAPAARKQAKKVDATLDQLLPVVQQPDQIPDRKVGARCRECPYQAECLGEVTRDHIIHLPSVGHGASKLGERLFAAGHTRITETPTEKLDKPADRRAQETLMTGQPWVSPTLGQELDRITYPAFYVDFETFQSPLPLAPGVLPNQMIPFQWSAMLIASPGAEPKILDFIDLAANDPTNAFCESLWGALSGVASIVFYSDYEVQTLRRLAKRGVPFAAEAEAAFVDKGVDLEKIVKAGVVHPDFKGRTSIKVVLPALCPESQQAYSSLAISNGGAAQGAYDLARRPTTSAEEAEEIRLNLLKYCQLDVSAMRDVAQALRALTGQALSS